MSTSPPVTRTRSYQVESFSSCINARHELPEPTSPDRASEAFLDLIQGARFTEAAGAFHIPARYDSLRQQTERRDIARGLEVLASEFGRLEAHRIYRDSSRSVYVTVGSGDITDVLTENNLGRDVYLTYRATFSRERDGYLTLQLVPVLQSWSVMSVRYGLDATREGATGRIHAVARRLGEVLAADPISNSVDVESR